MEPEPEPQYFDTFFTIMRLIYVILPGLGAYMSAVFQVFYLTQCGTIFHRTVDVLAPGSGSSVPSSPAQLFSSPPFIMTLGLAIITQFCSTTFVVGVANLYRADAHFRRRATPILAGLRTTYDFFFFKTVANVASIIAFLRVYLLLDVPGEFDLPLLLPAAAAYLVWSVCIAATCHAVALQAARGGSFDRRLVLVEVAMFWAVAAVVALIDGFIIAVMMAFPSQMMTSGMAMIAVLYTMVVVMFAAQPVVDLVFLSNFRP